jgi:hypothetical protein
MKQEREMESAFKAHERHIVVARLLNDKSRDTSEMPQKNPN